MGLGLSIVARLPELPEKISGQQKQDFLEIP